MIFAPASTRRNSTIAIQPTARRLRATLASLADPARVAGSQRFFKTAPGEYGAGDRFRGVRVPTLRALAKENRSIAPREALQLLRSRFHEDRLLALMLLGGLYARADALGRNALYAIYLAHTRYINNWDLVDSSAEHIVGAHLWQRSRRPLIELARYGNLWERRIAVLATFHFIRRGDFATTLTLAEQLLDDDQDLIHKAVGWMLREVGKRDAKAARRFLDQHACNMPRTMLRYAIERLSEPLRQRYLRRRPSIYLPRKTPQNRPVSGRRKPVFNNKKSGK